MSQTETNEESVLVQRIKFLEEALAVAHQKVAFWERHKTLAAGVAGESLIAHLVNGSMTGHNDSEDVLVGDLTIEVKMARLNIAKVEQQPPTKRWAWAQILGVSNQKQFDRLILLGEKDERFVDQYKDQSCPYVLFDIPYSDLVPDSYDLMTATGKYYSIQLTSNPRATRKAAKRRLYDHYQTTAAEIQQRYGL